MSGKNVNMENPDKNHYATHGIYSRQYLEQNRISLHVNFTSFLWKLVNTKYL